MIRRVGTFVWVVGCALAGAWLGRAALEWRQSSRGAPAPSLAARTDLVGALRWQRVAPGLLAAVRAGDRPWSYLGVPAWLAALGVNFALGAFEDELAPLRRMAGFDFDDDSEAPRYAGAGGRSNLRDAVEEWRTRPAEAPERQPSTSGFRDFPY